MLFDLNCEPHFGRPDRLGFRTETPATRTMADNAAPEHDLIAAAEAAEAAEAAAAAAPAPTPTRQSRRLQGYGTAEQEAGRPSWCDG